MSKMLRVSSRSEPGSVAGAIAHILRNEETLNVRAIGASAVNQTVKSIAVARSYLDADKLDIFVVPVMQDVEIDGSVRTAIQFSLTRCDRDELRQRLQELEVSRSQEL